MIGEKLLHDKKSPSPSRQNKLVSSNTDTGTDRMGEPAPTGRPKQRQRQNTKPNRRLTIPVTAPKRLTTARQTPMAWRAAGPFWVAVLTPKHEEKISYSDRLHRPPERHPGLGRERRRQRHRRVLRLPGADLSGEELAVRVIPKQIDEFPSPVASWSATATAAASPTPSNKCAATGPEHVGPTKDSVVGPHRTPSIAPPRSRSRQGDGLHTRPESCRTPPSSSTAYSAIPNRSRIRCGARPAASTDRGSSCTTSANETD